MTYRFVDISRVERVIQAGFVRLPQDVLKELFGVVAEDRVEGVVMEVAMFHPLVVVVVNEVLNVVVRADELNVLCDQVKQMQTEILIIWFILPS